MIKATQKYYKDIDTLLVDIKENEKYNGTVGILGGHYLLDYSKKYKKLMPLIIGETDDKEIHKTAEWLIGTFPTQTFDLALDLYTYFLEHKITSKIMLLVNDHQFPSGHIQDSKLSVAELRENYFNKNSIPTSFLKIIDQYHINVEDALLANKDRFSFIKDQNTFLFSEYKYRKKFDRSLKKKILKYSDYFYAMERRNGKKDIFLKNNTQRNTVCLTNDGYCGCSGEIMEYVYQRYKKDLIKEFILFVPYSCYSAVSSGIMAILQYLFLEYNEKKMRVQLISHLPFEPQSNLFTLQIIRQSFSYGKI